MREGAAEGQEPEGEGHADDSEKPEHDVAAHARRLGRLTPG